MKYYPDAYQFLRISSEDSDTIYKLFAVWAGGYTQGDAWQLNSGITQIKADGDNLHVHGYSGSVYVINKEQTFMTSYGRSVLKDIIDEAERAGVRVDMINVDQVEEW